MRHKMMKIPDEFMALDRGPTKPDPPTKVGMQTPGTSQDHRRGSLEMAKPVFKVQISPFYVKYFGGDFFNELTTSY